MARMVFCQYLKKEAPGLPAQFYPGELGKRIFENISLEAWQIWLKKQTMLVNEHHYNLMNIEHRKILEQTMIDFLFNGKDVTVAGYTPEEKKDEASSTVGEGRYKAL
ncbi:oxidative damage protection protein [Psittacicella hinzii]|uniref:Probable Fe(2+)-trafficking protein n=1 Tax=Psittacicella hinzii TaxID=2028575 RepID=A0A3A1YRT1_9GAMM|nr:oxidative damage protection protein [Psittacicella hinzii]RIY38727.1 oxidative damage protection protein [Psittacicella hinzii]